MRHRLVYDRLGQPIGLVGPVPPPPRATAGARYEMLYDGLGNPLGLFPVIAAALPAIASLTAKALPALTSILPSLIRGPRPGPVPLPAAQPRPTVASPVVRIVAAGPVPVPPTCPPPTMEECRRLYPPPPPPAGPRRRRVRFVRIPATR